jgi:hypothetical protein
MSRKTAMTGFGARAALALLAFALLGGCVSYYERHYGSPGVYAGGHGRSGVHYGSDYGYAEPRYRPINPVYYPYWSIDYFYFSRFHHPYSFYVGYREPLYYPYPGWALDVHFYSPRYSGYYGGLGFGYPWHGYGHFYPHYSLGFFAYHDRRHHRIRHIDRRLRELQEPTRAVSRRALLGYGRSDPSRAGIPIPTRSVGARDRSDRLDGRLEASRSWIRSDTLRRAERERGTAPRASSSRLELQRSRPDPASSSAARDRSPPAASSRTIRRQPDIRSERRSIRSAPPPSQSREVIRSRSTPASSRSRSTLLQRSSAPPPRNRSAPPPRSRSTPPPRSRSAPPPRSRSAPPRTRSASPPRRSSGDGGRSRRDLLRDRGGDRRRP